MDVAVSTITELWGIFDWYYKELEVDEDDEDGFVDAIVAMAAASAAPERQIIPQRANLHALNEFEARKLFRFTIHEIELLADAMRLPSTLITRERTRTNSTEGLAIMLRRLSYPNRLFDLVRIFGRSDSGLCNIALHFALIVSRQLAAVLDLDVARLATKLPAFKAAVAKLGPMDSVWAFIDGTARPCARPTKNQRQMYSGHKKQHVIKFQALITPDGIIPHLFGPAEGRRHDMFLLRHSRLCEKLAMHPDVFRGSVIYGDPGYRVDDFIVAPFRKARLSDVEQEFNKKMSAARVSVEHGFGRVVNLFTFLELKRAIKLGLSPIASFYRTGVIFTNFRTILDGGNQTTVKYGVSPPTLDEYLAIAFRHRPHEHREDEGVEHDDEHAEMEDFEEDDSGLEDATSDGEMTWQ